MSSAPDDTPVLDLIGDMTAASIERSELDERTLMLVRIAALIAVDAPPLSYLVNLEAGSEAGIEPEDIQQVMIGIAPVVGTARIASAATNIGQALGFAIAVAEAELEEESMSSPS